MTVKLSWQRGGEAFVVQTDGVYAEVRSTKAFAPGTPLQGATEISSTTQLRFKVKHCRRTEDGQFLITGRWLDLSRAARDELLRLVPDASD